MTSSKFAAVALILMAATLIGAPLAGVAAFAVTVRTDASSYSGSQSLTASGAVSPAPGPSTAVFLKIANPAGTSVAVAQAAVDGTTGSYQDIFVLGGSSAWTSGTYTITATWGNSGSTAPVNASTTFTYSPSAVTTTTTTAASTTTVTTTVTTVSTSTTTSTTTTTSVSTTTSTTTSVSVQTSTLTSTTTATTSALVLSSDTLVLLGAVFLVAILALVGVVLVRRR